MRVSKWGNSLAIRIPSSVSEALKLDEGDEVEVTIAGTREFVIERDRRREKALQRLQNSNWTLPSGWQFNREEANER